MGITDGRTDGGKFNSPPSSLCEAGDKNVCVCGGGGGAAEKKNVWGGGVQSFFQSVPP